MAKKGMNPDNVRQMAQKINDAADDIMNYYNDAKGKVTDLDWTGEDRDDYVSTFEGDLQQQVQKVQQAAQDLAERADSNAKEQEQASSK
ncbi:hypothetical protein DEO23_15490 [Brachybacterium endophyticum]|uniref:WXG100 family type VII secretion target n=1 Tax=Brachybacterium endophyticum TaxID=2182385 RepID=A0A2U2RGS9_9MICO|nr:WXG100 family type VII secretion target [Brachybacterium endophyticum]PWH05031.1 hypothetical protein DEO23_15490 [Brachybacterium endophyticum]